MNYSDDIFEKLVATIEEATSQAAIDLFNSTNETFYFFVLVPQVRHWLLL